MAKPVKYVMVNGRKYREGSALHKAVLASAAVRNTAALKEKGQPTIGQLRHERDSALEKSSHYMDLYFQTLKRAERLQCLLDAAGDALACKPSYGDEIPF